MVFFKLKSPTVKILELLRDAIPLPINYKTISHYALRLGYQRISIHTALRRLEHNNLIINSGRKKSKLYQITPEGLDCLYKTELKNEIKRLESYLYETMGLD
jgi:predicted transcriptional regulator